MAVATAIAEQQENRAALQAAASNLARAIGAAGLGSADGLERVGVLLLNDWRRTLSRPGTGRTYRRGGVLHTASAPGEPPARDTSHLINSTAWFVQRVPGGPQLFVGSRLIKAGYLEFGTRRMKPRPSLRPTIAGAVGKIPLVVAAGVAQAQRAAVSSLGRGLGVRLGRL